MLEKTTRYAGIENGHLLIGPIAIEGAMPGDSIEVRILGVVPRIPFGTTGRGPGRGLRQLDADKPPNKVTVSISKRNVGLFGPGVEVPLGPFMGVMGLCRRLPRARIVAAAARRVRRQPGLQGAHAAVLSTCRCFTKAGSSSPGCARSAG